MSKINGYIDEVSAQQIRGWVTLEGSSEPVSVELIVNNKITAVGEAKYMRKSLVVKGLHKTGKCEFRFNTKRYKDLFVGKDEIRINAIVEKSKIPLSNSPFVINAALNFDIQNQKFYYMHIAKSGGTTFNNFLASNFNREDVKTHLESNHNWSKENREIIKNYSFISGHLTYPRLHEILDLSDYIKISIFREPLSHLISHLNWVASISNDVESNFFRSHTVEIKNLSKKIRHIDFTDYDAVKEFVENMNEEANTLFNNCQMRYLTLDHRKKHLDNNDFEYACKMLGDFDYLTTLDQLGSFMSRLAKKFNLKMPPKTKSTLNKNKYILNINVNNDKILDLFKPLIEYDLRIYNLVKDNKYDVFN